LIATAQADLDTITGASGVNLLTATQASIDAIETDTNELQTDDVPDLIATLNDISTAQVNTEADTALSDIHLDHLLATDYDPAAKPGVATALLNELVEDDAGVSRYTANALEQAPGASTLTAAEIVDEWETQSQADPTGFHVNVLEIAQAAIDAIHLAGAGAITFTYTLTSSIDSTPIPDADVWVTSDAAGNNVVASGETDNNGEVTFYLDAGTVYVWRQKSGWNFTNPDTETVS